MRTERFVACLGIIMIIGFLTMLGFAIIDSKNMSNAYNELREIKEDEIAFLLEESKKEHMRVIQEMVQETSNVIKLGDRITSEEKDLIYSSASNFAKEQSLEVARHYIGVLAYVVCQHEAVQ